MNCAKFSNFDSFSAVKICKLCLQTDSASGGFRPASNPVPWLRPGSHWGSGTLVFQAAWAIIAPTENDTALKCCNNDLYYRLSPVQVSATGTRDNTVEKTGRPLKYETVGNPCHAETESGGIFGFEEKDAAKIPAVSPAVAMDAGG